jgi:aminoglycoside phosphotransferase family enzyme/predicted kinase
MTQVGFYPHHPVQVELRQTHISYVFLAGEYVYKVKKPVRFAFLDYSTLDKRHHFCREEVRLNRRLSPTVYLGVVPVVQQKGSFALGEGVIAAGSWTVTEYAVKMRRLPEERMLDRLLSEEKVGKEAIRAVAKKLVSFHLAAATDQASIYGAPEVVWQVLADNFQETEQFIGQTISEREFHHIQEYSRRFLAAHRELFKTRVREGKVREGHGDLRAEHICLTDDIAVFDCIEFNEQLRYCDVISEVGFLAMDLDFLRAPLLSEELVAAYETMTQDETLSLLLPFYKCYRAYVRGKVESLKSQEEEVPEVERERAQTQARRYFRLAYRYARDAPSPALVIACGLVGTGKSTVARMLGDYTGFEVFNSDAVRKRLARISPTTRTAQEYRTGIYSDTFSQLTYGTLLVEAEKCLKTGRGVIIDATFKDPEHRRLFLNLAAGVGVPVLFVECQAAEEEVFRRLKEREQRPREVSDATWEVYLHQREEFVPLREIPDYCHFVVNTATDPEDFLAKVEEVLYRPSPV